MPSATKFEVAVSATGAARVFALFSIPDARGVASVLAELPDLSDLLADAHAKLSDAFGEGATFSLGVVRESEVPAEIVLSVTSSSRSLLANTLILDRLDQEWWFEATPRAHHRVTITLANA